MIANLLRSETAANHTALESMMYVQDIMNHTLTIDQFKKLLSINFIIHHLMEDKLFDQLDENLKASLDPESRSKIPSLQADLAYWKINPADLPEPDFSVYFPENHQAELLGALYVLEGATLGGNVIKRHILANPSFKGHEAGLNYYGVYGGDLSEKWKSFVSLLNDQVKEKDNARCIHSANETFNNLIRLSEQIR